jgi:hypothetical protein
MNFLSPWFLLGALAVAGPIVFHLIRRWAREKTQFSSLMFLVPTPPRVARRRRVEHFWLLLLRCLLLCLLATAFARPFVPRDRVIASPATGQCQRVLLVDTSASMRRESLWNQARQIAERYLELCAPDDLTALMTFDRQPRTLTSFAEWSAWPANQRAALAGQRLAAAAPGWAGTHLGLALTSAAEQFGARPINATAPTRRELIVISDLQEGAALDGLQGFDWPRGVRVIIERVTPKRPTNAGLQILEESPATIGEPNRVHVRIANAGNSAAEKFQLVWSAQAGTDATGVPMEIYLPPGQARTFTAPPAPRGIKSGALRLQGDDAEFDNLSYYAASEREQVGIAYFGSEAANDPSKPRYYLERVFNETPRRQVRLIPVQADSHASIHDSDRADLPVGQDAPQRVPTRSTNSLSPGGGEGRGQGVVGSDAATPAEPRAQLLTVLNLASFAIIPAALSSEDARAVREWLTAGRTALLVLTDAQMGPTLAALAGVPEFALTEIGGNYALLGDIDFRHPLFAPFAESRFSDFTHVHFWKHRRWEAPSSVPIHVLARFDDGSPALVQLPIGQGNLLVLASGWNPVDSQLALSSKFPPLMETMLDWSGDGTPKRRQFLTGEVLPSPISSRSAVQWQKPDGTRETLAAGVPFAQTGSPGVYVAAYAGQERRFAVNLPLQESRTAPISPDELTRLGVPLQTTAQVSAAQAQERARFLRQEELENRQKLWRWLIAGVLAVALGETILSGWLARGGRPAAAGEPPGPRSQEASAG